MTWPSPDGPKLPSCAVCLGAVSQCLATIPGHTCLASVSTFHKIWQNAKCGYSFYWNHITTPVPYDVRNFTCRTPSPKNLHIILTTLSVPNICIIAGHPGYVFQIWVTRQATRHGEVVGLCLKDNVFWYDVSYDLWTQSKSYCHIHITPFYLEGYTRCPINTAIAALPADTHTVA